MECYTTSGRGYGLYYSSCEDNYKLLVVTYSDNVYIYSLKSDSWRKLNKMPPFLEEDFCWSPGFFLSENIYFQGHNIAQDLIRFDTKAEMLHKIEFPLEDNRYYPHFANTVHKGSIHLCVNYNIFGPIGLKGTCFKLWKYNADGDMWSKVVMGISSILISSDSSEESVGTPSRRVLWFGRIPITVPATTPTSDPPFIHDNTSLIPIETPTILPITSMIPPTAPTTHYTSSFIHTDSPNDDTPDTPLSPTHEIPPIEVAPPTGQILPAPFGGRRRRVTIVFPELPIPHGRPYRYHPCHTPKLGRSEI
ncbi:putative reverse transcriptase domain-containing protein [Tanacetum coccineum]